MNLVPGINETTNAQTTKPETTKEAVEVNVPTTVAAQPTVTEKISETTEVAETKEITTQAKTNKNVESTTQTSIDENCEKTGFDVWKVIPIAVVIAVISVVAGIIIYKKKK